MDYTATAAEYDLHDDEGQPTARIFAISYTLNNVDDRSQRPVTFVYNGGPGSSSIWLHMAFVGPQVIDVPSDAKAAGVPPYSMKSNPLSLLQVTDLVFMDPVGTGYSHALGEKKDSDFWSVAEDAASMNEFVRLYITREKRWNSPKYLLGESYGTIRAALMGRDLQGDMEIALNGIILVSPAMNMGTLPFFVAGNDLPYATHLPSLAAAAYYHQRLPNPPDNLDALIDDVREFAATDYLTALFRGDQLADAERQRIAEQLHQYTGLSTEYILRSDLRIYVERFRKELLRDQGLTIGRLDARYVYDEVDDIADMPDADPSSNLVSPAFVALFQDYVADDLQVAVEKPYRSLNRQANQQWQRSGSSRSTFAGYIDVTGALTQAATNNPALRVFVANGYHDLTTSFNASEYMMAHSGIDRDQMTIKNYYGGHMMYLYLPSFDALAEDLMSFIGE
ncbi:MAG: peptidase S10 [Wenzhouxiangellaceae bacterium]